MSNKTLSVQLHEALERIKALDLQLAVVTKGSEDAAKGKKYADENAAESRNQIEQTHLILDGLLGADTRKAQPPETWNQVTLGLPVRFALFLAGYKKEKTD